MEAEQLFRRLNLVMREEVDELEVGGEEVEGGKLGGREPDHLFEVEVGYLVQGRGREGDGEEDNFEFEGEFGVAVASAVNFGADLGVDAEFFA